MYDTPMLEMYLEEADSWAEEMNFRLLYVFPGLEAQMETAFELGYAAGEPVSEELSSWNGLDGTDLAAQAVVVSLDRRLVLIYNAMYRQWYPLVGGV